MKLDEVAKRLYDYEVTIDEQDREHHVKVKLEFSSMDELSTALTSLKGVPLETLHDDGVDTKGAKHKADPRLIPLFKKLKLPFDQAHEMMYVRDEEWYENGKRHVVFFSFNNNVHFFIQKA